MGYAMNGVYTLTMHHAMLMFCSFICTDFDLSIPERPALD